MTVEGLILAINYGILCYFLGLNGFYLALYAISFREISDYARREVFSGFAEMAVSKYAPAVSLIVPAFNEEANIVASVRSFLALNYPRFEVVVINDGSKDRTVEILREKFGLKASDQRIQQELETQPVNVVYTSATENMLLVDKTNGGKADALNAGICAARHPLICCIDADVILEEDALLRVARPMIESSDVAAVGGIVRVANGCTVEAGRVTDVKTSPRSLPNFQIVEYLRAFLAGRTGWSSLNALLIISGAFGMFRRRDVVAVGGYLSDTVGEDMELVTRLQRTLRNDKSRERIVFVPDPVAWTEVPSSLRVLRRQRDRWHRGLLDTLHHHRSMLFKPRYGTVGLLGMPYFVFFEAVGPVIELVGYLAFATGLFLGILDIGFALAFFVAAVGLGIILSIAAVLLEEMRLRRYHRWSDLVRLTAYAVLENFGYRQLNALWRAFAILTYLRKNKSWGAMERQGFDRHGN
ncbi:glycosyltransferase family 2 protein [Nesterenkonia natronophila]|uniref:Glycosyltransferase family 2 protein n=1 Tax=Nesterenkonia natronophila TaxID=2174932 RepID=A0A3A4FCA2_9MICC|nr:glycosyltransferase [Nesterenkonia natronophila]RJN32394.1 glycosyltransferase family 2 protein [Nesterenkonia natronophila]